METLQLPFEFLYLNAVRIEDMQEGGLVPLEGVMMLMLCTNGHAAGDIDGRRYRFGRGDIFLLAPSLFAHISELSADFRCTAVRFDYDFYVRVTRGVVDVSLQVMITRNPHKTLSPRQFAHMTRLFDSLSSRIEAEQQQAATTPAELHHAKRAIVREMLIALGQATACEVVNLYLDDLAMAPASSTRREAVVQQFLTLVYEHFREHRDLPFYADRLCISPRYLSAVVKQSTGRVPGEWISERVMSEARQLLAYTDLSVKQISLRLHFPNQSFFGKYFRLHAGTSPKLYRQGNRGR